MIILKTEKEIIKMREAGRILANITNEVSVSIKIGTVLKDLDGLAYKLIKKAGAEPAFLNYQPAGADKPYPASICASLNETIVHGIPSSYALKNGDLLKIDFGLRYQGFCADIAVTLAIGSVSPKIKTLIDTTQGALFAGIAAAKTGNTLGDIGWAINHYVKSAGFKVLKGLTGHGIGRDLHEEPDVLNEGERNSGLKLKPGLILAIEPMVSAGSNQIIQLKDNSIATIDGSLSAHFEHTVAITKRGPEILTVV